MAFQWNRPTDLISGSEAAAAALGVDATALPVCGSDFSKKIAGEDRERRDATLHETTQVDDGDGHHPVVLEEWGRLICDEAGEVRDVIAVIRRAVAPGADQAGDQMKDPETALASKRAVLQALTEAIARKRHPADWCCR